MTFVLLGSHAERQSQEGRKQTGRKGGCSRCIFSCALPPRSAGRQLGRRAQGQMVAAGARAQRAAQGISLCTILEEQNQSPCSTGATFCQSVSQPPGLCHPKVLSGSLWGIFPAENNLGAVHIPSCWDSHLPGTRAFTPWCFACARGNLPVRALPAGTEAECVVMGTFSCCD